MKLEKAIERLSKFANIETSYGKHLLITTSQQHDIKEAINTVLQHVKHLQKEKEEYETKWNNTAHELRIFKNECVPKCNIREKIKMLKKIYELVNVESEADYCLRSKINILEDLLKEE